MKVLLAIMLLMLVMLQYRLWFGEGSIQEVSRLTNQSAQAKLELQKISSRNQALKAEVNDLKGGLDAIEERARSELGMIDSNETFYQFLRERRASGTVNTMELRPSADNEGSKRIDRSGTTQMPLAQ